MSEEIKISRKDLVGEKTVEEMEKAIEQLDEYILELTEKMMETDSKKQKESIKKKLVLAFNNKIELQKILS